MNRFSNHLDDVTVSVNASIKQALAVIDKAAIRGAIVVDDAGQLAGTVTDGDIRRGLLRGVDLDAPVGEVTNKTPTKVGINCSRDKLINMMQSKGVLFLPVVDQTGALVGVEFLTDLQGAREYPNTVFIMAGGFGTRLRPLTDNCPKPMLPIGDKPMLQRLIERFRDQGFSKFVLSLHFLPQVIKDHFGDGSEYGVSIEYVYEDSPLGTAGALSMLADNHKQHPVLIINGDILTQMNFANLIEFHNDQQGAATMCVREYGYQVPYGVVMHEGRRIVSIDEKPTFRHYVNAGIYVLSPSALAPVTGQPIDMPELFDQVAVDGGESFVYPVHEYWLDIGRMDDFKKAQSDLFHFEVSP